MVLFRGQEEVRDSASRDPKGEPGFYIFATREVRVFQTKTSVSLCLTVFAALLSILCSGCGGNSSSMNNSMSQAQAQAVSDQISQAIAQALGTTVPDRTRDQRRSP